MSSTPRVAVVTGSNKGIGFGIVKRLCQGFDGDVYLTARDEARGRAAVAELNAAKLFPKFHQLDISDSESIHSFRKHLEERYGGLDVLVNNAGISMYHSPLPFEEHAAPLMRTNFFGTLNVCMELFPLLRPHARVVNVVGKRGVISEIPGPELKRRFTSPDLDIAELCDLINQFLRAVKDQACEERGWPKHSYAVSKVGLMALTSLHQRQFDSDSREDIVVNAANPGLVQTDMAISKGLLPIDQGAVVPTNLALLPPGVQSPKGQLVWDDGKAVRWDQK